MSQFRFRPAAVASVIAVMVCAAALTWVLQTSLVEKRVELLSQVGIAALGLVAAVATLVTSSHSPLGSGSVRRWLAPRGVASVLLAILAGFSAMSLLFPLLEPRNAVESRPGALEDKLNDLLQPPPPPPPPLMLQRVVGHWGEAGTGGFADCQEVIYAFVVEDRALIVTDVRRPAGEEPFEFEGTIFGETDDFMKVEGEKPARAKGRTADFRYETNGRSESLLWADQGAIAPLHLVRCP